MAVPMAILRACLSQSQSMWIPNLNTRFIRQKLKGLSCSCTSPSPSSSPNLNPLDLNLSGGDERPELSLRLSIGTHLIPHPAKADKGGEDAFLISSRAAGGVIAVADGVSGWAEQNVDPSLFSQELMAHASSFLEDDVVNLDPQILLKKAHYATTSVGSATVIIAMLLSGGILKIANVGDCGLKVIREGHIIFSTSPQEHYFDCPYQLSSEVVGQTYLDAVVSTVELMERDVLVMGSDGLFDNVFDHEIVSTVAKYSDVSVVAKALGDLAHERSMDLSFDSPYSMEAKARGFDVPWWKKILGVKLTGGKLDDITVIVGQVIRSDMEAEMGK